MNIKAINKFHLTFLAGLILLSSLIVFTGCGANWGNSPSSTATKPKEVSNRPNAPVVVDGVRTSYADLVEKTAPAVVQITAINSGEETKKADGKNPLEDFFQFPDAPQERRPRRGFGSGVIVSADGTVLTNHHVVDGATKITVEMSDKKSFEAEIVGSDPPSDLAVLKIKASDLPFLKLGDSDNVRVGDIVLAIGNPLGIGQTVTSGIISAKGRQTGLGDGSSFQDFLQTDAPINQGNSGGALVSVNGELIGINSQILSQSGGSIGIGFAIPSNMAKSVMEQLLESGKVSRGMMGVSIGNVNNELAEALGLKEAIGVIVNDVQKGKAAEKAGIKSGDVIIKFNGEKVEDGNVLRNKVAASKPGTEISLTIIRNKTEQEIKVKLDEFEIPGAKPASNQNPSSNQGNSQQNGKFGFNLLPLTPEISRELNLSSDVKGVVITEVDPGSPADETGIRKGDVIMEINQQPVTTLDEVRSALEKSGDKSTSFKLARGNQKFFIAIKP